MIPDISGVIPCYTAEKWVARAIDSVLAQEGDSVEVFVVDDWEAYRSPKEVFSYGKRMVGAIWQ